MLSLDVEKKAKMAIIKYFVLLIGINIFSLSSGSLFTGVHELRKLSEFEDDSLNKFEKYLLDYEEQIKALKGCVFLETKSHLQRSFDFLYSNTKITEKSYL